MICIGKTFEFSASHRLSRAQWSQEENNRVFGKCANPNGHGHNYKLEVTVCGTQDGATGMVMDASRLTAIIEETILKEVDHKNLDVDVPWLSGSLTTVENIASAFWTRLAEQLKDENVTLYEIKLWETSRIFALRRAK